MAPIHLEGSNLGQRHKHYNELVNNVIKASIKFEDVKSRHEDSDMDKLLKIDLANHYKNVDYILEAFKSEDVLHASRAIKLSTWLITGQDYAHVINPQYLHEVLAPQMMTNVYGKLILKVRIHLKDESRVEEFFKYYEDKSIETALKWLPNCSVPFIESMVKKHTGNIDKGILKRLSERSFSIFEVFINEKSCHYFHSRSYLKSSLYLIRKNTEQYLDILEKLNMCVAINRKYAEVIMRKCPDRIVNKFDFYAHHIDLTTFVKYIDQKSIEGFLLKQRKCDKLKKWFTYDNIKYFIKAMPQEDRLDFVQRVFIDKTVDSIETDDTDDIVIPEVANCEPVFTPIIMRRKFAKRSSKPEKVTTKRNIYQWYKLAPFTVAMPELQKLIRTESAPEERTAMLGVMISSAGKNLNNIEKVIQFCHDRHINEPFRFKIQFVNKLLSAAECYKFNEKMWNILDQIFYSMEVYSESENNVEKCVETIILHKLLHNEDIPEIIEKKFGNSTLSKYKKNLNEEQRDKVFSYLYKKLESQISAQASTTQTDLYSMTSLLSQLISVAQHWDKDVAVMNLLLTKIKEVIKTKKDNSWESDVSIFYKNKFLRRQLFEASLILNPSEETCLNALKHDPALLSRYAEEVDALRRDEKLSLVRLLKKLKVYWPQSLCKEWASAYQSNLGKKGLSKSVALGLCSLLSSEDLLEILRKFAPENTKIVWSETDETRLNLQKQFAKNMHIARPLISPDTVLMYAKGDYLQFTLPSLLAVYYKLCSAKVRECIPKLMNSPVSLQKHGIRLAFSKLKPSELNVIATDIWKSVKNVSIRAIIFQRTFELLCTKQDQAVTETVWQVLEKLIDNLTEHENNIIYNTLGKVRDVPKEIQPKMCVISYKMLRSLPPKLECEQIARNVIEYTAEIMETVDHEFVKSVLLENINETFAKNKIRQNRQAALFGVIASYLVCVKNEDDLTQHYNEIFVPIKDHVLKRWDEEVDKDKIMRSFLKTLLNRIDESCRFNAFNQNIIVPVQFFKLLQTNLSKFLTIIENYKMLTTLKLKVVFFENFAKIRPTLEIEIPEINPDNIYADDQAPWKELCTKISCNIVDECMNLLKADMNSYFPSIWMQFAMAFISMMNDLDFSELNEFAFYDIILNDVDFIEGYLLVIKLLPKHTFNKQETLKLSELFLKIKSNTSLEVKIYFNTSFL